MAQRNIDFGTFPDDPSADPIRIAFQKTQQNFDEIYAGLTANSVESINKVPGAGITVNQPTGNVVITANIACVQVSTSSLSIGRGSNGNTTATITASSQTLVIDINPNNVFSNNFAAVGNGLANLNGTLTVNSNAQPNITSVGVLSNLSVSGNLISGNASLGNIAIANYFQGDGSLLTNLPVTIANKIENGNSNIFIAANANVEISSAGNSNVMVITGNGANITGYLTITANLQSDDANLGNTVIANYFIGSGNNLSNIQGSNVLGNVSSAVTANFANFAGDVTNSAQPNITSIGTLTSLVVSGNITAGNVYANSGTLGASLLTGTLTSNLQPNITEVGILSNLSVTGNVTANNIVGNGQALTSINGANITGTVANANLAAFANVIIDSNQPNITNVGTLTSLIVSGNLNAGNISGGNLVQANYFSGDGSLLSNLTISAGSEILNGNSNVRVYANSNVEISVAGNSNVVSFNAVGLVVNGTISSTGNANLGNIGTAGFLTVTGNANIGNIGTAGVITATGNIRGANLITSGGISATGNASVGNLSVTGLTNLGNISNITISGAAGYLTSDGAGNLSFNTVITQSIPGAANNLLLSTGSNGIAASANISFNDPILSITGNLSVTGNANVGNIGATNILGTLSTASQPNITSTGTLASLNVADSAIIQGNLNVGKTSIVAGTSTTDQQALSLTQTWNNSAVTFTGIKQNITDTLSNNNSLLLDLQVGSVSKFNVNKAGNINAASATLTNLTVNNATGVIDFITTANVSLGAVANLHISGGSLNQYLKTDGSGNLSWATITSGINVIDDTSTNSNVFYPTMANANSGSFSSFTVSSSNMYFNPSTGQLNVTTLNTLSDERSKENIKVIDDPLQKISELSGVTFKFKDSKEVSAGLLAQEVQKVLPEVVRYTKQNDTFSLNYNGVVGLLLEAVKSLNNKVIDLENKLYNKENYGNA